MEVRAQQCRKEIHEGDIIIIIIIIIMVLWRVQIALGQFGSDSRSTLGGSGKEAKAPCHAVPDRELTPMRDATEESMGFLKSVHFLGVPGLEQPSFHQRKEWASDRDSTTEGTTGRELREANGIPSRISIIPNHLVKEEPAERHRRSQVHYGRSQRALHGFRRFPSRSFLQVGSSQSWPEYYGMVEQCL